MAEGSRNAADIDGLISDLASRDSGVRVLARRSLVDIGGRAVNALIGALTHRKSRVRWEAAKALGEIAHPAAAPALVRALEDRTFDVRWLAAAGLIAMGSEGLANLLLALIDRADSVWLRDGAHHVLHDLAERDDDLAEDLRPVLSALESGAPSVEVPLGAKNTLAMLAKRRG
jgi:HEAT repeat protein